MGQMVSERIWAHKTASFSLRHRLVITTWA